MRDFGLRLIVGGILAVWATQSSAALVDFTNNGVYTEQSAARATGTVGGVSFTVTGSSNALTYTASDAPGPVALASGGTLRGQNDGIGIGNDEVGGREYLTVTFDRDVRITALYFLDLFSSPRGASTETASIYAGTPPSGSQFLTSVSGTEAFAPGGIGFGGFAVDFSGSMFSFDVGVGNDGVGIGDFALAGIEIAPIPLPAGALLLGTAFLGLLARRRGPDGPRSPMI